MRLLVKFKPGSAVSASAAVHARCSGTVVGEIPQIGVTVVEVPDESSLRAYKVEGSVLYAEVDSEWHALRFNNAGLLAVPNDPLFSQQWGPIKVKAADAWDRSRGQPTTVVGILDTGIAADHPDVSSKVVVSINFSGSPDTIDRYGHGTHCAGIAAAVTDNALGVAGMAPEVKLANVKVLGDSGSGSWSGVAQGIVWAADNGVHVISMSLGGSGGSQAVEDAVNYAWGKGLVIVAAAGNSGSSTPSYPAFYANCIAVAATDINDQKASFSNFGDWVDLAAPGVAILNTVPFNGSPIGDPSGYKNLSGTSMACPHAAGLAALLYHMMPDQNGDGRWNDEVRNRMEATCDNINVPGIGAGRINALAAVSITPTPTGAIGGNVTDTAMQPIVGASVSDGTRTALTGPLGAYLISGVPAGTYVVTASATGYISKTQTVTVMEGITAIANFVLTAGPTEQPMWAEVIFSRVTGPHLRVGCGIVTEQDMPLAGVAVALQATHQDGSAWNFAKTTDANGEVEVRIHRAPSGSYLVKIISLTKSGYLWDKTRGITEAPVTKP